MVNLPVSAIFIGKLGMGTLKDELLPASTQLEAKDSALNCVQMLEVF